MPSNKTIFEAFEKATYMIGMLEYVLIYVELISDCPEDIDKLRNMRNKNERQYRKFRARLERILGIDE